MSDSDGSVSSNDRLLSLQTALGAQVLQPIAFQAEEALSAPYSVMVEAISEQATIDPDSVLFQPACLTIAYHSGASPLLSG